jgi:hypothetical protein
MSGILNLDIQKKYNNYDAYLRYKKQLNLIREISTYNNSDCKNEKRCNDNLQLIRYMLRNA